MSELRISANLSLPLDFATDSTAVLAKKGAGKTYTGSVIAEEYAAAGVHFNVVDPTGAWFGLRSNVAGDGPGLPIVIFGGEHADVEILPDQGAAVADLIVRERISVVLDMSGFRKGEQIRFMTGYAEQLYHVNRDAFALIVDEADAYAPQRTFPEGARLLGAMEDIVRRGRRKGIGTILITQRPAVLNKNVLEQCDNLFVLQITGPNDRKAIEAWVEQHATPEELREVNASLASLKKGEVWVWSPTSLGILKRVQIRLRTTFDSGRTPKVGETVKAPKMRAEVDLEQIRKTFAVAIETAKSDDPKVLRARIAELEAKVVQVDVTGGLPAEVIVERVVEKPVLTDGNVAALRGLAESVELLIASAREILEEVRPIVASAHTIQDAEPNNRTELTEPIRDGMAPKAATIPAQRTSGPVEGSDDLGGLGGGPAKMLVALAGYRDGRATRRQLGALAGYVSSGGGFRNYLSALRTAGYIIDDGKTIVITAEGARLAGERPAVTTREIIALWRSKLKGGPLKMFGSLVERYPNGLTRQQLAASVGMEASGGGFRNYLSALRTKDLIAENGGEVFATRELFPTGALR